MSQSIEDIIYINELIDMYNPFLSEKQQKYLDLYYAKDYSLTEISELYHISKQAVSNNLTRTIQQLEQYEQTTHWLQKKLDIQKQLHSIQHQIEKIYSDSTEIHHSLKEKVELKESIDDLLNIVNTL